jgi:integrative and conjugative element protein (TIGR02256 family)
MSSRSPDVPPVAMVYRHPFYDPDVKILIEDAVLTRIQAYRQLTPNAPEAGGILLGYRRGVHLHLVEATLPGAHDQRSRTAFWRRDPAHQNAATNGWTRTHQTLDYVGEWHTHPEAFPSPSSLDLQEWRDICTRTREMMTFLIVGTRDQWFGVGSNLKIRMAADAPEDNSRCDI